MHARFPRAAIRAWCARSTLTGICLLCQIIPTPSFADANAFAEGATGDAAELQLLRQELDAMRRDYDARIADLEARLTAAETRPATAAAPASAVPVAAGKAVAVHEPAPRTALPATGQTAFNPAIGVIFQGQAWDYSGDPDTPVPGFPAAGETGPIPEGLSLGETEIIASASVDNLFTAQLTAALAVADGETAIELEEAWIETLALPGGLAARFGRFYSDIGYLNDKHSHTWDFVDQPLAYQAFLDGQYGDDGVQVRWLAPTDLYLELGAEVFRGDSYPASGAGNGGLGSSSLSARLGGDVGSGSSWLTGLSWLHAESDARASGPENDPVLFDGTTDLLIAEFVWKWAPNGNWRQRNLVLQSELLWRNEDGRYLLADGSAPDVDRDQWGWYVQTVYQPVPRWRIGARFDLLSSDDPGSAFAGTVLEPSGSDPKRYTLMADWSPSEFSRFRIQYAWDRSGSDGFEQWGLQYIQSIGAHGAHSF